MKTLTILAALACAAFAQNTPRVLHPTRLSKETSIDRTARFNLNQHHEARAAAMREQALASPQAVGTTPQITISCPEPLMVVDQGSGSILQLCDPSGANRAQYRGTFYKSPNSVPTALAPAGSLLYAMDNEGNLNILTDKLGRGIADDLVQQFPGLAWTNRIMVPRGSTVYAEHASFGRLFSYVPMGVEAVVSETRNLPKLARQIQGTMFFNNYFYAIDNGNDTIVRLKYGPGQNQPETIGHGHNISSFTIDESGLMFVGMAPDCFVDPPQPPGVNMMNAPQTCTRPQLVMVRESSPFNAPGPDVVGVPDNGLLDMWYSFVSHSMYAFKGKLYIVSLLRNREGRIQQQILLYRYSNGRNGMTISEPTVFAGPEMFSEFPYLTSLTSFSGGSQ